MWEIGCADEDYKTMRTFFKKVKKYLNKRGRILIHFGTSGDVAYFKYLIRKNGLKKRLILKSKKNKRGWMYFTYKLTI
jgi:release factor glutamine methyltransferase